MSENITIEKKNGNLVITAPIEKDLPLTKSGKGRIVASTHGNIKTALTVTNPFNKADNNVILSVNCYVQATDEEAGEKQAAVKAAELAAKNS